MFPHLRKDVLTAYQLRITIRRLQCSRGAISSRVGDCQLQSEPDQLEFNASGSVRSALQLELAPVVRIAADGRRRLLGVEILAICRELKTRRLVQRLRYNIVTLCNCVSKRDCKAL